LIIIAHRKDPYNLHAKDRAFGFDFPGLFKPLYYGGLCGSFGWMSNVVKEGGK
jgi:hypothetical protein